MHVYTSARTPAFHEKLLLWKARGELCALDLRGYETRNESVVRLVARADAEHCLPDFSPLMVHTGDRPINQGDAGWRSLAFAEADGYCDVPVPDFLFDSWPQVGLGDYEDACAAAAAVGADPAASPRLGWIGNCDTNPIRWQLHALGQQHGDLLEIEHITWISDAASERLSTAAGNQLTIAEQVRRWGLLIDVEGNGWSARLKLLLHSGRPVFVQERPWREWFWPALRPMAHFIPVRRDLSDLIDQVRWARANPERATAIGLAGQELARRELTREAAARAWALTLGRLADQPALPYAPEPWRQVLDPVLAQLGALGSATTCA